MKSNTLHLPVERCPHCGVFYKRPAVKNHTPEACAAVPPGALPTREPASHKLPNRGVTVK
jgi:hypothetical protein